MRKINPDKVKQGILARSKVIKMPSIMPDLERLEESNETVELSDLDEWDSVDEWEFNG